ncbi:MAG: hypothetical protein LBI77_03055 [Puniceicoccales bacterium]|jgi:hypothetical protein|nr:hypothetical protein [Puniceicoccales bacterium]
MSGININMDNFGTFNAMINDCEKSKEKEVNQKFNLNGIQYEVSMKKSGLFKAKEVTINILSGPSITEKTVYSAPLKKILFSKGIQKRNAKIFENLIGNQVQNSKLSLIQKGKFCALLESSTKACHEKSKSKKNSKNSKPNVQILPSKNRLDNLQKNLQLGDLQKDFREDLLMVVRDGKIKGEMGTNVDANAMEKGEALLGLYANNLTQKGKENLNPIAMEIVEGLFEQLNAPNLSKEDGEKIGDLIEAMYKNPKTPENIKESIKSQVKEIAHEACALAASVEFGLDVNIARQMVPKGRLAIFLSLPSGTEVAEKYAKEFKENYDLTRGCINDIPYEFGQPKPNQSLDKSVDEKLDKMPNVFLPENYKKIDDDSKDLTKDFKSLQFEEQNERLQKMLFLFNNRDFGSVVSKGEIVSFIGCVEKFYDNPLEGASAAQGLAHAKDYGKDLQTRIKNHTLIIIENYIENKSQISNDFRKNIENAWKAATNEDKSFDEIVQEQEKILNRKNFVKAAENGDAKKLESLQKSGKLKFEEKEILKEAFLGAIKSGNENAVSFFLKNYPNDCKEFKKDTKDALEKMGQSQIRLLNDDKKDLDRISSVFSKEFDPNENFEMSSFANIINGIERFSKTTQEIFLKFINESSDSNEKKIKEGDQNALNTAFKTKMKEGKLNMKTFGSMLTEAIQENGKKSNEINAYIRGAKVNISKKLDESLK